jgi:hypothetical protein
VPPSSTVQGGSNGSNGASSNSPQSSNIAGSSPGAGASSSSTTTSALTLNGATSTPVGGTSGTTLVRGSNQVPCNPACEICSGSGSTAGNSNAASRKKRACTMTWGEAKTKLVGNNCGYEIGSSATAKWTDAHCVAEEKACIPPKGSVERPNYETCSNPVPCERDTPGWKCSTCFIVADDGTDQHLSPGAAPVGCDAIRPQPSRMQVLLIGIGAMMWATIRP